MPLKKLLGLSPKDMELLEEMQAALRQMQEERKSCEMLILNLRTSNERLQVLDAPIANVQREVAHASTRLAEIERRFGELTQLASDLPSLDQRTERMLEAHTKAEDELSHVAEETRKIWAMFEDLTKLGDSAMELKDRISGLMEMEGPLQKLRRDAEGLRGQMDGAGQTIARLLEENIRAEEAQRSGNERLAALERRIEELGRIVDERSQRVAAIEDTHHKMDGFQQTVDVLTRDIGTLKALGDAVVQKSATLEVQRDAIERVMGQADQLERSMRQIDAGLRQQQELERGMAVLQNQMNGMRQLHDALSERSDEISQLQGDTDGQTRATRQELGTLSLEMKKVLERFDFETRGLDSVSQRVADLRTTLSDYEGRFAGLSESSKAASEFRSQAGAIAAQIQGIAGEVGQLDRESAGLQSLRRELEETGRSVRETVQRCAQIESSRDAIQSALRDYEQLKSVHATVKDALEQTRLAHGEIAHMREGQSEAQTWMGGVEKSVLELKDQVADLNRLAPAIEDAQRQAQRLSGSLSDLEARRGVADDLQRRLDALRELSGTLEERGHQLQTRMEVTEQRFAGLSRQTEDAERLGTTLAGLVSQAHDVERKTDSVTKELASVSKRCESVEALAEQTRALRLEIEQRQSALSEASRNLEQASDLRRDAAAAAQQMEELSRRLTESLGSTEDRSRRLEELAAKLEKRSDKLKAFEKRLHQFDDRLTKWQPVEEEIGRTLDQITARQGTVESLQQDLHRMITMAEKTAHEVREITSAHGEIERGHKLLTEVKDGLEEIRQTASSLDERKRQMAKAEERLRRADALLVEVRSSIEGLQAQKTIVDQAVEKAGSLRFLIKQAEAMIEGWRDEREMASRVRSAVTDGRDVPNGDPTGDASAA